MLSLFTLAVFASSVCVQSYPSLSCSVSPSQLTDQTCDQCLVGTPISGSIYFDCTASVYRTFLSVDCTGSPYEVHAFDTCVIALTGQASNVTGVPCQQIPTSAPPPATSQPPAPPPFSCSALSVSGCYCSSGKCASKGSCQCSLDSRCQYACTKVSSCSGSCVARP